MCVHGCLNLLQSLADWEPDVALVANFAEDLASHPSGAELVKYLLIFAPAWYVQVAPCGRPSLQLSNTNSDTMGFRILPTEE